MNLIAVIPMVFCTHLYAESLDQAYLHRLRAAKTTLQLTEVQEEHESLDRNERICLYQLKQNVVPWACYVHLRLKQKWGLIDIQQANSLEAKLNDRCKTTAEAALHESADLLRIPKSDLSGECRRWVEQALEISHYRSDEIFSQTLGAEFENIPSP